MDPRLSRFAGSINGFQLRSQSDGTGLGNVYLDQNPVNGSIRFERNFLDLQEIQFLPTDPSPANTVLSSGASGEDELNEDWDLSDAILGYISKVLMEEDMEEQTCMLQESLDLQAAEKSFYDVLGIKYPPSPKPQRASHYRDSPDDCLSLAHNTCLSSSINGSSDFHDQRWVNISANYDASHAQNFVSRNTAASPISPSSSNYSDACDGSQLLFQFRKGAEEANRFLPNGNRFFHNVDNTGRFSIDLNEVGSEVSLKEKKNELGDFSPTESRRRKNLLHREEAIDQADERRSKQAAIYPETVLRSEEIDLALLCSMGKGESALSIFRETLRNETNRNASKIGGAKGAVTKGKGRGKKHNRKKEVIDLRTLLITCAQAVAADDRRNANELLKQIRQHSSPFGDGNQRLAHCFADGIEARLAGTGSQIHKALISKKTSAADYIKAYYLYIASSPFRKISNFMSNKTIMLKAGNAMRIHVIDFGILYGFQWPTFIQRIAEREGGPPRLRITGIDFPQPGFRPAQRIEETGRRLAEYAKSFKVPFQYNAIAKKWENVNIEDLKLDEDEFLVVNSLYRTKNLLDETVAANSSRSIVLNLIRKINPSIFVHGVVNGAYNAPFFVTRFREALFHFSALFDVLETNVSRERSERMLIEREIFGREALNVIACEGWERVERPETYKQWHVRNLRAGFVQIPIDRKIMEKAHEKVRLYHKDFLIDEDGHWLLQGWKGRTIYAISCWKPA